VYTEFKTQRKARTDVTVAINIVPSPMHYEWREALHTLNFILFSSCYIEGGIIHALDETGCFICLFILFIVLHLIVFCMCPFTCSVSKVSGVSRVYRVYRVNRASRARKRKQ
jgi:hypothetical protein